MVWYGEECVPEVWRRCGGVCEGGVWKCMEVCGRCVGCMDEIVWCVEVCGGVVVCGGVRRCCTEC